MPSTISDRNGEFSASGVSVYVIDPMRGGFGFGGGTGVGVGTGLDVGLGFGVGLGVGSGLGVGLGLGVGVGLDVGSVTFFAGGLQTH
jgi:hypothetical protein